MREDAAMISTATKPAVDTSLDTSVQSIRPLEARPAEPALVAEYPEPAGVRSASDLSEPSSHKRRRVGPPADFRPQEVEGEPEAEGEQNVPLGAAEKELLADPEAQEEVLEAEAIADAVHRQGGGSEAVMDALEAAEQQRAAALGTAGAGSGGLHEPTASPAATTSTVDDEAREASVHHLRAALMRSAKFDSNSAHGAADKLEAEIHDNSKSKNVYLAVVANAARLALTMHDMEELYRVAAGKPAEDPLEGVQPTDLIAGLTGVVVKPDH